MNGEEHENLHKSQCIVRGDLLNTEVNYEPYGLYSLVASHEEMITLLAVAAAEDLLIEGGDVSNAYLYSAIDYEVSIEQPTDSNGKSEHPGMVYKVLKSMHRLNQEGCIWVHFR